MGEAGGAEALLERFDRMSQLHAQNADELAFLGAKERRLKGAVAEHRSAAGPRDEHLRKLRAGLRVVVARVQALEEEERRLVVQVASINAQADAALLKLEADILETRTELEGLEETRGSKRIQAELDDLRYAHAAEVESLEAEAAEVKAKLGAQSMRFKISQEQEQREVTELQSRVDQNRVEIQHNECVFHHSPSFLFVLVECSVRCAHSREIKSLTQTAQSDEQAFEKRLQHAKQAATSGTTVPGADPEFSWEVHALKSHILNGKTQHPNPTIHPKMKYHQNDHYAALHVFEYILILFVCLLLSAQWIERLRG